MAMDHVGIMNFLHTHRDEGCMSAIALNVLHAFRDQVFDDNDEVLVAQLNDQRVQCIEYLVVLRVSH
ncbi:hypothetical protein H257_13895 [Aphanomyces astaci]|uniref:Uncharacterized protein n=1 Tax=Aphanomyces astaci TaxID=112090 RepID=W4FU63_APHAT|nr:hypothetical protein H257_13895 [Aphanomyces astaci]ETV70501.1 hypothetical protein H257_13895 [Aphanomyces astaci]|eukprot:XP_009839884.1 hypothetical protein H257_13895 [Aphanomyces astaci]